MRDGEPRRRKRKVTAGPIGVDLGARSVRILQLQREPDGTPRVIAETRPLPAEVGLEDEARRETVAALIRSMLRAGSFAGRRCVACVPERILRCRIMRVGATAASNLDADVHEQFASHLEMAPDEYRSQFFDAGEVWEANERRHEIVAMAAPIADLDGYLSMLLSCDLTPLALDARPSALVRALVRPQESTGAEKTTSVVLDLSHQFTTLTVTGADAIRLVRRIGAGLGAIDQIVAENTRLSLDEATTFRKSLNASTNRNDEPAPDPERAKALEAAIETHGGTLAREIAKCLQYYGVTFREPRPATAIVVGSGAGEAALHQAISRETHVRFRPADDEIGPEWARSAYASLESGPAGLWAAATGLAMYDDEACERMAA